MRIYGEILGCPDAYTSFSILGWIAQSLFIFRIELIILFKFLVDILRIPAITIILYRPFQAAAQKLFASVGFVPSIFSKNSLPFTEPHFLSSFYASRAYRKTEDLPFFPSSLSSTDSSMRQYRACVLRWLTTPRASLPFCTHIGENRFLLDRLRQIVGTITFPIQWNSRNQIGLNWRNFHVPFIWNRFICFLDRIILYSDGINRLDLISDFYCNTFQILNSLVLYCLVLWQ